MSEPSSAQTSLAETSSPPRLYLIDGYSNIFRAYYAIRGLSNTRGEPTNAAYGFLQMLRKLLREFAPHHIGVAFDVAGPSVRKERYDDYKANRKPMPDDLRPQVQWIRQIVECFRIPLLEEPGYEADDVLGTLAKKAVAAGYEVVLVSPDKDLMQLVGDGVLVYHTGREKLYDAKAVEEDFGVPPAKVVDVLALMGDTSDNVPGVPGIGEKGARQLIAEHGDLATLLDHAESVKRKSYREGLVEHREAALLSQELVTIHCDLPVAFDAPKLVREEPDRKALLDLCWDLDFQSVVKELEAEHGPVGEPVTTARETESADAFRVAAAALGRRVVVATVGEGAPRGLAVAAAPADDGDDADAAPLFADFRRDGLAAAARDVLTGWLADPEMTLVGHDLKEALRLLGARPELGAELVDTMLVSYVLRPSLRGHDLDTVAMERLHLATTGAQSGAKLDELLPGDAGLLLHAAERVELPRRWAAEMERELATSGLDRLYRDVERPLMPVLLAMEERGILLDTAYLGDMSRELGAELGELEDRIYEVAGERFNLNSPQQLGEVMFEKLGYPAVKRTRKTKSYATGADVLEELAAKGYPLPDLILRYRELSKLKSTYVDALPALVAADGRLHTRFNQAVAATGRLSSANPNLQNIPIRTELGHRIRRAFRAPEGRLLIAADYSQIELRVLAHIADERVMIEAFRAGVDIHAATAGAVFGVDPLLVNPDQRRIAKVINFGIIYGMSSWGLSQQLGIGRKEAEQFIAAYRERYPGVARYTEETVEAARESGKVETLYGRVRYLPDIRSRNYTLRENARRMAINARIQGTAADLLKLTMIAVDRRLAADHPDAALLLTVHDELVLETPAGEAEAVAAAVRQEMESVADLRVPLRVESGVGPSWFEAKS